MSINITITFVSAFLNFPKNYGVFLVYDLKYIILYVI